MILNLRISNDIHKRIVKWQRKQTDDAVTKLREHIHYKVNCRLNDSNCLDVHVYCEICNKQYKLHPKNEAFGSSTVMISNWTSHIKRCVKEREVSQKQTGKSKQATLSKFVTVMPNSSGKTSDDPSSSAVTTANNQEQSEKCCLDAHSTRNVDSDEQSCSEEHHSALSTIANIKTIDNNSSDSKHQGFWLAPPVQVTQEGMKQYHL